jgi:hypothetical protein
MPMAMHDDLAYGEHNDLVGELGFGGRLLVMETRVQG